MAWHWMLFIGALAAPPPSSSTPTIACLGGSATSGGGPAVGHAAAYPALLKHRLADLGADVINSAHGATSTTFAALNFDSLVPSGADADVPLVVWEFAINDSAFCYNTHWWSDDSQSAGCIEDPLSLMLLLRNMAEHPSRPRLAVVLLWDNPFRLPVPGQSVAPKLKAVLDEASALGLVAGVVDVAAWVAKDYERRVKANSTSSPLPPSPPPPLPSNKCFQQNPKQSPGCADYVVDIHHPNQALHKVIAEKLEVIARGVLAPGTTTTTTTTTTRREGAVGRVAFAAPIFRVADTAAAYEAALQTFLSPESLARAYPRNCKDRGALGARLGHDVFTGWRRSQSWMAETPRLEHHSTSEGIVLRGQVSRHSGTLSNTKTVQHGKASPIRLDRKLAVKLPPCRDGVAVQWSALRTSRRSAVAIHASKPQAIELRVAQAGDTKGGTGRRVGPGPGSGYGMRGSRQQQNLLRVETLASSRGSTFENDTRRCFLTNYGMPYATWAFMEVGVGGGTGTGSTKRREAGGRGKGLLGREDQQEIILEMCSTEADNDISWLSVVEYG